MKKQINMRFFNILDILESAWCGIRKANEWRRRELRR
jgi:hypothetical protein